MRIASLGLVAVLLVGCTGGDEPAEFDASLYRDGDCTSSARAVFDIDAAASAVSAGDVDPEDAASDLREHQEALRKTVPSMTDAKLKDQAQEVVDAVGFYRIGIDAKNYTPKLAKDVEAAAGEFLDICKAG